MSDVIPFCVEDLTKEWLEKVLKKSLKESEKVEILNIKPIKTEGYLSKAAQGIIRINDKTDLEKVFIKLNLPSNDPFQTYVNDYGIDKKELNVYQEILPALMEYEIQTFGHSKIQMKIPKFYAGGFTGSGATYGFYLIIEDVSDHYKILSNSEGLSVDLQTLCLEEIAYFHALCYSYGQKSAQDFSIHPTMYEGFCSDENLIEMMKQNLVLMKKDMNDMKPNEEINCGLDNLSKNCMKTIPQRFFGVKEKKFLIHGDYWSNNIMFGEDHSK